MKQKQTWGHSGRWITRIWQQIKRWIHQGSRRLPGQQLTLITKLLTLLLILSLGSVLVVGFLSWSQSRSALTTTIFNQLAGVRASRAYQIESLFRRLRDHISTLSEDRMVVEAMVEFNRSFRELNSEYIPPEWEQTMMDYYTDEFFPRLSENLPGDLDFLTYRSASQAAQYLQYYYIADNPNPIGEKDRLVDPGDGSDYSEIHEKYHLIFQNLIQKFGYYDLFLINANTGDIVYSVYKETDYATSLYTGPYQQSNLSTVLRAVEENPEAGSIQIVDFQPYRPSYMAPAAFLAGPIYNGPHLIGVLAIQLPVDEINAVMTGNENWQEEGLGQTGEVYLIGSDFRMRSISRFLVEDKASYLRALRSSGTPEQTIDQIDRFETTILLQPVETDSSRESLSNTGLRLGRDYLGEAVLSSFSPLQIQGLEWAILAEIDQFEAYQPVRELQLILFITTVILILVITAVATLAMERLFQPLQNLIRKAQQVSQDQGEVEMTEQEMNREFGELSKALQGMVDRLQDQSKLIQNQQQNTQTLLSQVMPATLVEKVQQSQGQPVVETIAQATVIVLRLPTWPLAEGISVLSEVLETLDQIAERHEIERIQSLANRYLAVCGLVQPRVDHCQRSLLFVKDAMSQFGTLRSQRSSTLAAGMALGPLTGGVLGEHQITYDVWGDPVNQAIALSEQAAFGTLLMTQSVYERLSHLESMESVSPLKYGGEEIPIWELSGSSRSLKSRARS